MPRWVFLPAGRWNFRRGCYEPEAEAMDLRQLRVESNNKATIDLIGRRTRWFSTMVVRVSVGSLLSLPCCVGYGWWIRKYSIVEEVENEGDVETVIGFCVSSGGFLPVAVSSLWLVTERWVAIAVEVGSKKTTRVFVGVCCLLQVAKESGGCLGEWEERSRRCYGFFVFFGPLFRVLRFSLYKRGEVRREDGG